jgi:dienelactone hydrolase
MYGKGKLAEHPDTAKKFMQATMGDQEGARDRFEKAMTLLQDHKTVDDSRIAAQGYCFGGAVVLNMARMGLDLDGVVSFHGSLGSDTTAEPGTMKASVQAHTGGADPFAPPEQVAGFVKEMQKAEAHLELFTYPGVKHSFTNPGADAMGQKFDMPLAYDKASAEEAWQSAMAFYADIFMTK